MLKQALLLSLVILLAGCGQKSTIKVHQPAERLGDGKNFTQTLILPLSDKTVASYDSSLESMNPIFKGFIGTIMNLGASLGAGKQRVTLIQPVPDLPLDEISSLKIKRIFFYIESPEKEKVNFDFLRSIAVKISSVEIERKDDSYEPIFESSSLDKKEKNFFDKIVKTKDKTTLEDWDQSSNGLLLLRYKDQDRADSLLNGKYGKMYLLNTQNPRETRDFFIENYKENIRRIYVLNNSILIEVKPDPVNIEIFDTKLEMDKERFSDLTKDADVCKTNCMDFKLPDSDLLPLLRQGNAIRVDAYIDPQKAPKSFQLKGFIEFEVKIPTTI